MRVLIQRVARAAVAIANEEVAQIGSGLLVFVGIEDADTFADIEWLCAKIANLRIFSDAANVMNLSVKDIHADILIVSQFTLHALTKKGNRPSYSKAAKPEIAIPLYGQFVLQLQRETGRDIPTGKFGADMQVSLINDGPVTIFIDSKNKE
jgi:D-tyrosyl-tRNA(Tyr) deacylase